MLPPDILKHICSLSHDPDDVASCHLVNLRYMHVMRSSSVSFWNIPHSIAFWWPNNVTMMTVREDFQLQSCRDRHSCANGKKHPARGSLSVALTDWVMVPSAKEPWSHLLQVHQERPIQIMVHPGSRTQCYFRNALMCLPWPRLQCWVQRADRRCIDLNRQAAIGDEALGREWRVPLVCRHAACV
jgi:hypothetical protein